MLKYSSSLQASDPDVRWSEQQVERRRVKRDLGSELDLLDDGDGQVRVAMPDPLFRRQWYLNRGAADGSDMNVQPAWREGYTGRGVVVTILDDGIQYDHPDLSRNYDPMASTDINGKDDDPTPQVRCLLQKLTEQKSLFCGRKIFFISDLRHTKGGCFIF